MLYWTFGEANPTLVKIHRQECHAYLCFIKQLSNVNVH